MGDRCAIQYIDSDGVPSPIAYFHWSGANAIATAVRLVEFGTASGYDWNAKAKSGFHRLNGITNLIPNLFVALMDGNENSYSFHLYPPVTKTDDGLAVQPWTEKCDAGLWTYDGSKKLWYHNKDRRGKKSATVLRWCKRYYCTIDVDWMIEELSGRGVE